MVVPDQVPDELLPAGLVLLHALGHADDLTVAGVVHADRDQHADVLHAPSPGALVPYAVHEQVRAGVLRHRPAVPFVDLRVYALQFVYLFNGLCAGLSRVCWPCYR